jgi:hypothetical protein
MSSSAIRPSILAIVMAIAPRSYSQDNEPPERPSMPVVGRPTEGFYNAAGTNVKVQAEASPRELATNEWLTYTLAITKLMNAADVEKPSLKALPEFKGFQVDESTDLDPSVDATQPGQRSFRYKLRPLSTAITLVPEVPFSYYDPRRIVAPNRPQDKFPKTLSNPVPLRVMEAVAPPAPVLPLVVPSFAGHFATDPEALAASACCTEGCGRALLIVLVAAPLLAGAYVVAWRIAFPNAAKLRRLKRNRAVRRALTELAALAHLAAGDSTRRVDQALLRYLHERFDLPADRATAVEVADFLRSLGLRAPALECVDTCLRQCESQRFGRREATTPNLAVLAEEAIIALEESA